MARKVITRIQDVELAEFNRANESQLREMSRGVIRLANQRIRRLESHGIESPSLQGLGTDRRFSTRIPKGLSKSQRVNYLRSEYARARNFLSQKTSTIGGYNEWKEQIGETIREKYDVELNSNQLHDVVKVMNRLRRERKIGGRGSITSEEMFRVLSQRVVARGRLKTTKDYNVFSSLADKIYKNTQGANIDFDDETEEFTID